MSYTQNTPTSIDSPVGPIPNVRECPYCGKPLKTTSVTVAGKTYDGLPCFGSCGCERSAQKLRSLEPSEAHGESRENAHRCPKCGGGMTLDGRTGYVSECPWCGYSCVFASDLTQREKLRRDDAWQRNGGAMAVAGVPELYRDAEPDYQLMERIVKTGKGLYLQGDNGTYKTLKAASVLKAFVQRGSTARFVSSAMLTSEFRDAMRTGKTEAELYAELSGCDLLVIDDMGKENPTSWASTLLYTVIDARYGGKKPIVVTSNYSKSELIRRMSNEQDDSTARAIVSRLFEMTEKVEFGGGDRRRNG